MIVYVPNYLHFKRALKARYDRILVVRNASIVSRCDFGSR
jgi:hypothetical protein